jgi:choloylglycine hydrolase
MKRIFTLLVFSCLFIQSADACTTFFICKKGEMIFGRNYDWVSGSGMVCTNQRGLQKTSLPTGDGPTISWVSAYGSITFNQWGKEFPMGGMNERGLVVELMWLSETQYPKPDKRAAVDCLQWIQYQLDRSATITDVIATDAILRIASKGTAPLHYLIADATGHAAVIEFLNGKMVVHKADDLPVAALTNSIYKESVTKTANQNTIPSFADGSLERFATACSMVNRFEDQDIKVPVVDYALDILNTVAQPSTQWSIVYDLKNKKIHFRSSKSREIKVVAFSAFDFSCNTKSETFAINQKQQGDVSALFQPFTAAANRTVLEKTARESYSQWQLSDESRETLLQYSGKVKCEGGK